MITVVLLVERAYSTISTLVRTHAPVWVPCCYLQDLLVASKYKQYYQEASLLQAVV